MNQKKMTMRLSATLLALALGACAGTGTVVDEYGKTDKPVFPDVSKVTMDAREGVYPDKDALQQLRPGLSRDQIYHLLGRPHFAEGFRVREWDYVLYFGKASAERKTCQLKVLFDKDLKAQSYHWLPTDCPP
ncbi:MAG: outer membrane protein assembly factor BamE [Brachymonas sp.]|nr:outer membrane protein assembly factor BamE [Brachymonas sp.]